MKIKRLYRFIIGLSIIVFFSLVQGCRSLDCAEFDYNSFGLDTNILNKPSRFVNRNDTVVFYPEGFQVVYKQQTRPSFTTLDECINGVFVSYRSSELNFVYNVYYIKKMEEGYEYGIYSGCFDKVLKKLESVDDLTFAFSPNNKKDCPHLLWSSFTVERGLLVSFIDNTNQKWELLN